VADTWPLAKCWAYRAWAVENDPWGNAELAQEGYVAQEIAKTMARKIG